MNINLDWTYFTCCVYLPKTNFKYGQEQFYLTTSIYLTILNFNYLFRLHFRLTYLSTDLGTAQ